MTTQSDSRTRIVSLSNLEAMCRRASGWAHTFEVSKVSRSRVHVTYSNPDEYGYSNPITAVFPCLPGFFGEVDNPRVILGELMRTIGGDDEAWQHFSPIVDAQPMHRSGLDGPWSTREEVNGSTYLCPDGVTRTVDWNHPYTNDTFAAFEVTAETSAETFARIGGKRHWAYFVWSDCKPVARVPTLREHLNGE